MSLPMLDKYLQAFLQTLAMVGVSAVIAIALGLSLALVLTVTASGGLSAVTRASSPADRAPFTRLLGAAPGRPSCRCHQPGAVLRAHRAGQPNDVDPGLVEAARAMGCRRRHIVRHVLLPEALPGIIGGMTVSVIAMINASAMAGAVGARAGWATWRSATATSATRRA